jgi:hypothetical protein
MADEQVRSNRCKPEMTVTDYFVCCKSNFEYFKFLKMLKKSWQLIVIDLLSLCV